jgi:adenosylmethionine-8-amino-7-oxononanoate aminotransferase
MKNEKIMEKDLKYNWHPCTQMKDHEFLPLIPIKKGEGIYLIDFDDNRYIDAISSHLTRAQGLAVRLGGA